MKFIALGLLMFLQAGQKPNLISPCGEQVIHPMMHVTKDVPASQEVNDFVNGITFSCPKGMVFQNQNNLRQHMSYKDILNQDAGIVCVAAK